MAASSSYCYSDITYGVTNNAANNGLSWSMGTVLPDSTPNYIELEVNGLAYRYTITKDPTTDSKVHIRNEHAVNDGYIFEHTDNWSGFPGGTIQKYFRFPYTYADQWGDGEIAVEGDGTISNATVTYNYKMEVNEQLMKCANTPLADPTCRGYAEALADYLQNMDVEPDINDPFYDEWVQAALAAESDDKRQEEVEEELTLEEETEEEERLEVTLGGENSIEEMVDTSQQQTILAALAQVPKIEPYYSVTIPGGQYADTLVLKDNIIKDNRRALRNLSSDKNHRKMVRSQYDRE